MPKELFKKMISLVNKHKISKLNKQVLHGQGQVHTVTNRFMDTGTTFIIYK